MVSPSMPYFTPSHSRFDLRSPREWPARGLLCPTARRNWPRGVVRASHETHRVSSPWRLPPAWRLLTAIDENLMGSTFQASRTHVVSYWRDVLCIKSELASGRQVKGLKERACSWRKGTRNQDKTVLTGQPDIPTFPWLGGQDDHKVRGTLQVVRPTSGYSHVRLSVLTC